MIYEVRQETRYEYDHAVPHGRHVLRMTPSDGSGQDVMSSDLTVEPAPAERQEDIDFFGNVTTWILIDRPHDAFVVRSHSVVMVARPPLPDPTATRPFEEIAAHAVAVRDLGARSPAHFIYPSRRVDLSPEVTAYARASFRPTGRCSRARSI